MFFRGIYLGHEDAVLVLVKKFQKNVKKHYSLMDIQKCRIQSRFSDLEEDISAFYSNQAYMIEKRLYSQDRRPAKTVSANPGIVIGYNGENGRHLVDALRMRNVRAEAVIINSDQGDFKEEYNKGLGRNFYVHKHELKKKLFLVFKQNRIIVDSDSDICHNIVQKISDGLKNQSRLEQMSQNPVDKTDEDILLALSMPIWFRETIKYARAYSA